MAGKVKGLRERLRDGETIIVAEGYLFEFESRGYLKAGAFVPEVVLERPDLVKILHEEFVHAGSDVVLAFTYYGHRERLRFIGREDDLEPLNRKALQIARQVADETGTLMAGNICNTPITNPGDKEVEKEILSMYEEQIQWAVEGGADFIVGETMIEAEAELALEAMKKVGNGLPLVLTLAPSKLSFGGDNHGLEACKRLEDKGADVVGLNCSSGPKTIVPMIEELKTICKGPIAALPVLYRTNESASVHHALSDIEDPSEKAFPLELDAWLCSRKQVTEFGKKMKELGVQYVGLCCGNRAHFTRALTEAMGKTPPGSRYCPDMSQHLSRTDSDRYKFMKTNFSEKYYNKTQ